MIALALDTSGAEAGVAVVRLEGDVVRVCSHALISAGMRHGVELFPTIERALRDAGVRPLDVRVVAVGTGPGSYTGLRVGITAARAYAYAAGSDLIGVPSCDAWAAAVPVEERPLAIVLDAHVRSVYLAVFENLRGAWVRVDGPVLIEPAAAAARTPAGAVLAGDGAVPYAAFFPGHEVLAAPSRADAREIAAIALRRHARGERDPIESVVPLYLRKTDAEIRQEAQRHG